MTNNFNNKQLPAIRKQLPAVVENKGWSRFLGPIAGAAALAGGIANAPKRMFDKYETPWNRSLAFIQGFGSPLALIPHPATRAIGFGSAVIPSFLYDDSAKDKDKDTGYSLISEAVASLKNKGKDAIGNLNGLSFKGIKFPEEKGSGNINAIPSNNKVPTETLEPLPELEVIGDPSAIQQQAGMLPTLPDLPQAPTRPSQPATPTIDNYLQGGVPVGVDYMVGSQAFAPVGISNVAAPVPTSSNTNLADLLALYENHLQASQPTIKALEKFINNYDNLVEDSQRQQRFWTGLAGYTGNNIYQTMANNMTPITQEKDRLALIQELMNQRQSDSRGVRELVGNAAMAAASGLPAEAAFSNNQMVGNTAKIYNALQNLEARKYAADQALAGRIYAADSSYNQAFDSAMIDAKIRWAIKNGDWENAIALQNMRNNGDIQRAMIQNTPWVKDDALFRTYEALGSPAGPLTRQPALGLTADGMAVSGDDQARQLAQFLAQMRSRR